MRFCAIYNKENNHIVDHLAPLCHILNMPLYLTDSSCYEMAKKYYPHINIRYLDHFDFEYLAKNYDALFYCLFMEQNLKNNFKMFHNKNMHLIFCPHGNGDKGFIKPFLKRYEDQEHILTYGIHYINILKNLGISQKIKAPFIIGNYRQHEYLKNKTFYQKIVEKEILPHLDPGKKTLLYAPTWNDEENLSSFFDAYNHVYELNENKYNLIIKLHPYIKQHDPAAYYRITQDRSRKNFLLLSEFPYAYGLFDIIDGFIGDFSSMIYDFFSQKKPMFFLNTTKLHDSHPTCFSHQGGIMISSHQLENLEKIIDDNIDEWPKQKIEIQTQLFHESFAKKDYSNLKEDLIDFFQMN